MTGMDHAPAGAGEGSSESDAEGGDAAGEQQQQQQQQQPAPKPMTAKEKAAARRRRILEQGRVRMDVVAGEVPPSVISGGGGNDGDGDSGNDDDDDDDDNDNDDTERDATATDGAAANAAEAEEEGGSGASRPSGSQRLAAMRRRRFKKVAASSATEEGGADDASLRGAAAATTATATAPEKEGGDDTAHVENDNGDNDGDDAPENVDDGDGDDGEEKDGGRQEGDDSTMTEKSTGKKKYLGVAKMRRMRLAEKKKREEQEGAGGGDKWLSGVGENKASASGRKPIPPSLSTVARSVAAKANRTPVLLHLATTLAVFLGGVGLGVVNSPGYIGVYSTNRVGTVIKEGFAPVSDGVVVLRALGLAPKSTTKTKQANTNGDGAREALVRRHANAAGEHTGGASTTSDFDDEFSSIGDDESDMRTTKPRGAGSSSAGHSGGNGGGGGGGVPNIDPVFRVDLDEFTNGPGIIMGAARFAVEVHRFITYLLYHLPLSIMRSILALPGTILGSPPLIFALALIVRAVGRDLLGARLPDSDGGAMDGEGGGGGGGGAGAGMGGDDKRNKDVLSMMMNAAKAYVANSFPVAAATFRVLRDARADMYIALCGLFVGLVLPLKFGGGAFVGTGYGAAEADAGAEAIGTEL